MFGVDVPPAVPAKGHVTLGVRVCGCYSVTFLNRTPIFLFIGVCTGEDQSTNIRKTLVIRDWPKSTNFIYYPNNIYFKFDFLLTGSIYEILQSGEAPSQAQSKLREVCYICYIL